MSARLKCDLAGAWLSPRMKPRVGSAEQCVGGASKHTQQVVIS
jgi:hypothetical protein